MAGGPHLGLWEAMNGVYQALGRARAEREVIPLLAGCAPHGESEMEQVGGLTPINCLPMAESASHLGPFFLIVMTLLLGKIDWQVLNQKLIINLLDRIFKLCL